MEIRWWERICSHISFTHAVEADRHKRHRQKHAESHADACKEMQPKYTVNTELKVQLRQIFRFLRLLLESFQYFLA